MMKTTRLHSERLALFPNSHNLLFILINTSGFLNADNFRKKRLITNTKQIHLIRLS